MAKLIDKVAFKTVPVRILEYIGRVPEDHHQFVLYPGDTVEDFGTFATITTVKGTQRADVFYEGLRAKIDREGTGRVVDDGEVAT